MKDVEGYVLKPIPHSGPGEIHFYELLETTNDPIILELKKFVPPYLGTTTIEYGDEGGGYRILLCIRTQFIWCIHIKCCKHLQQC